MKSSLFFLLLAAMLLGSVSVSAQTSKAPKKTESDTPLKGDVNGDGVVDVADINVIIDIMKNGGETSGETTYYWYVGTTNPTSITDIQDYTTKNEYDGLPEGWREIGTTLVGFEFRSSTSNSVDLNSKTQYYLLIPNDLHLYNACGDNCETTYYKSIPSNIPRYKAFQYLNEVWSMQGVTIRK